MKSKFLFILILLILDLTSASGELIFRKENSLFFKLYGGNQSASSFFDLDQNVITSLIDDNSVHVEKKYSMEITKSTIGLLCEYSLTDKLILFADMPITFNSLQEKYLGDSLGIRYEKANYSLTHLEFLGIGAKYEFYSKKSYGALIAEAKIPPGFKKGLLDTSKSSFLADGAFEFLTGLAFGIKSEKYLLESMFLYNYRGEELVDQFIIRVEAGISTVPKTKLSVTGDFVLSLQSFKYAIPLKTNQIVTQEDYFALGFEFALFFYENIYGEFNYNIKLLGKNSWNTGTYKIGLGILF